MKLTNIKSMTACVPALAILFAIGCSRGDGVNRAEVRGEVKVDGAPLGEGSIDFFPAEGTVGPTAGGVIANGKYDIPRRKGPAVGRNRVEIHCVKKTGRMVPNAAEPGTMREETVEGLPADVNSKSTLVRDVSQGSNVIDFVDLKGLPLSKGK